MIHIVDGQNRHLYTKELDQMYRHRHQVYVEQRGWKNLKSENGREIDQFDDENAVYFLRLNRKGETCASIRLLPTTGPHLLGEVYNHLVSNGEVPRDPHKMEMTRIFAIPQPSEGIETTHLAGEIMYTLFQWCLDHDITHLTTVADTFFLPICMEVGYQFKLLGLPTPYDEGECIALELEVNEASMIAMAEPAKISVGRRYWQYLKEREVSAVA